MNAVFKKEIRTYFNTLSGYVFLGFFVLINAYFFSQINIRNGISDYSSTLTYTFSMFLILIPVLTMRLFAEETRQKTDQLLYTSPISVWKIVFGKFFAAAALFLTGTAITALFPVIMSYYGEVNFVQTFSCFMGYFLLGAALISVGIFISVLTDNQIIAAVGTFAAVFFILMMDGIIESMPNDTFSSAVFTALIIMIISFILYSGTKNIIVSVIFSVVCVGAETAVYLYDSSVFDSLIAKVLEWFSVMSHFSGSFYMGVFKLSDVVYYISFIFAFLYITVNTIEKRRWR